MTFKKDYINYLLHTVVNSPVSEFKDNYRLSKLVDTIVSVDDIMKVTYLVGKTAGLEGLFKYLLYVSDKIDKSQVTIFNLKDNFDYDKQNLVKICQKIIQYKVENVQDAIDNIEEEIELTRDSSETDNITQVIPGEEEPALTEELTDVNDEQDYDAGDTKLTLIENTESYNKEAEVFELDSITDSLEQADIEEKATDESENTGDYNEEQDEESDYTDEKVSEKVFELDNIEDELKESGETLEAEENVTDVIENFETAEKEEIEELAEDEVKEEIKEEILPEIEIEVHKPVGSSLEEEPVKEEAITNEAYYKFETKFFEEVKILEKLFVTVDKDRRTDESGKLSEKCLQCLTEIIEITSELSSLSRQLSFDLIADIFLTMNIFFTKVISQPEILTGERIKLFDSSLALVNSLIKGEDYLNYDTIVDKIEKLKSDMSGETEEKYSISEPETQNGAGDTITEDSEEYKQVPEEEQVKVIEQKVTVKQSQMDSAVFKLKYLVKEFEKSFNSISGLKGEYSKYDALEKINELNNALRMIAKISAIVKLNDVLKLAEVTYVFLKYVKDYRMNLMEPEIKQIVKYIIFTFKMLLTNRKPEDFNVLVQHLNNPVKIFADS